MLRAALRLLQGCLGKRTQTPSPCQTPTLATRCKDIEIKSENVPKVFVTLWNSEFGANAGSFKKHFLSSELMGKGENPAKSGKW